MVVLLLVWGHVGAGVPRTLPRSLVLNPSLAFRLRERRYEVEISLFICDDYQGGIAL